MKSNFWVHLLTAIMAHTLSISRSRYLLVEISDVKELKTIEEIPGVPCEGQPFWGMCDAPIGGFTFDPVSKTCKDFHSYGCGHTKNGFTSKDECEAKCMVEHESHSKPSLRFNDLGPMKIGEIKMLKVDPSKKDCKLNPDGVYYVKKEFVGQSTFFFASLDKEFKLNEEVTLYPIKDRYISQAGYTDCRPGFIDYTETYDGTRGTPDIRNCGVGTVFATLCMVDPELNMLPSNRIDEEFKDEPSTATKIKKGCRKFLGLEMWSDDVGGPYKNFNAALNTGLNKFLIRNIPDSKDKYVWMDTEKAKSSYDPETKTIGPEKIEVFGKKWWFCDEIKGELPKFPNFK